jgi:hypothetical protein
VVACVLNRRHTLGPDAHKRSRGELILEALDHPDAVEAVGALAELAPDSYRGFNLLVADNRDAYWLKNEAGRIAVEVLPPGLTMLTAVDRNELAHPRVARHLPRFEAAPPPDPERGDWTTWTEILASQAGGAPDDAMTIVPQRPGGFGTVSSALIALPAQPTPSLRMVFLFAAGLPGSAPYAPVAGL